MIQFFDAQEGWVIGGDAFYHTTDGGLNWTQSAVPPGTWAYGARFFDRLHGVAVGEAGNVVRTEDGGQTWQTVQPQGSSQRLWDVEYADASTAFLAGDNGVISRSTDAGATWSSIQSGGAAVTHGFDKVDGRHAWAGQDAGEIVYTTNGGTQWIRASVRGFDDFGHLMAVAFANRSRGWAAGGNDLFGGSRRRHLALERRWSHVAAAVPGHGFHLQRAGDDEHADGLRRRRVTTSSAAASCCARRTAARRGRT